MNERNSEDRDLNGRSSSSLLTHLHRSPPTGPYLQTCSFIIGRRSDRYIVHNPVSQSLINVIVVRVEDVVEQLAESSVIGERRNYSSCVGLSLALTFNWRDGASVMFMFSQNVNL